MLVDFHANKHTIHLDPLVCPEGVIVRLKVGISGSGFIKHLGLTVPPNAQHEDRAEWSLHGFITSMDTNRWVEVDIHDVQHHRDAGVYVVEYADGWVLETGGIDEQMIRTPLPYFSPFATILTPIEERQTLRKVFETEELEARKPVWEIISEDGLISE